MNILHSVLGTSTHLGDVDFKFVELRVLFCLLISCLSAFIFFSFFKQWYYVNLPLLTHVWCLTGVTGFRLQNQR